MDTENEKWIRIAGFEDYSISDQGRVFSHKSNRLMTCWLDSKGHGYHKVKLHGKHKSGAYNVYRLMMLSFCPTPLSDSLEVAHNDGTRTNDRLNNLRWTTRKGNAVDRIRHGTEMYGENNHSAKLTGLGARVVKRLAGRKQIKQAQIAKIFGVSVHTVSAIQLGQCWTWLLKQQVAGYG